MVDFYFVLKILVDIRCGMSANETTLNSSHNLKILTIMGQRKALNMELTKNTKQVLKGTNKNR